MVKHLVHLLEHGGMGHIQAMGHIMILGCGIILLALLQPLQQVGQTQTSQEVDGMRGALI